MNEIVEHLNKGLPLLYPTETIWGLGVKATDAEAVKSLYQLKLRDQSKPMSLLVKDIQQASSLLSIVPEHLNLMSVFWPGPVTFVLPDPENRWGEVSANTKFLGLRCSPFPFLRDLLAQLKAPLTTTSANLSGQQEGQRPEDFAWLPKEVYKCFDPQPDTMLGQASLVVKLEGREFQVLRPNESIGDKFQEVARSLGFISKIKLN